MPAGFLAVDRRAGRFTTFFLAAGFLTGFFFVAAFLTGALRTGFFFTAVFLAAALAGFFPLADFFFAAALFAGVLELVVAKCRHYFLRSVVLVFISPAFHFRSRCASCRHDLLKSSHE